MEEQFKIGDVVALKSSPQLKMTVNEIYRGGGGAAMCDCIWFNGNEHGSPKSSPFQSETLMRANGPDTGMLPMSGGA